MTEISERLLAGDRRVLSRVISQFEKGDPEASQVLKAIDPHTGGAYTVGITGPPGAGKSTMVDRLTQLLRQKGLKVGIIGVDPTSPFTGGAILGDRIRMQRHYLDDGVFIRSVATRGSSGGVPRIVKGMVRLLDAGGIDVVLVETVGVGQSELGIMEVADTILVTMIPESGDAIQTLKAGIMEIADIYVVNKSDRDGANQMVAAIRGNLGLDSSHREWDPPVLQTQALTGDGIEELWSKIQEHRDYLASSKRLEELRSQRRKQEFLEAVEEEVGRRLKALVEGDPTLIDTLEKVAVKDAEPFSSAIDFLESFHGPDGLLGSLFDTEE
ncbi:MAG: methylmalonyl Co-A mutase-associated GTPase MeaB [Planctomyces sp.]|nr:methylmalonyl Co-A mutase-associated GTPase MeaB [Planctomyces sp.]